MKTITKLISALFAYIVLLNNGQAQALKQCGTMEMQQRLWDANPQLYQEHLAENARLEAFDKEAYANEYKESGRAAGTVYIIPVVFHVLHQYGAENISDAQIFDAIKWMTNDFRKLNSDTVNTVAAFKTIAGDSEIEFRLAQKDPNGNCTNGIDRIVSSLTNVPVTKDNCKINSWNRNNYLNIWVVKSFTDGIAGYAQFPGGPSNTDGIVVLSDYVGSIGTGNLDRVHTLTHELGHFFTLYHIWDSGNAVETSCGGSDFVSDTPLTMGHYSVCPLTDQTCTAGVTENVQNFMDYSYCYTMFTKGQSTRMRAVLNPISGSRKSLCTTTNLTTNTGVNSPAVLCKADFQTNIATNSICQGASLTFTDLSWSGTPTSRVWSFSGGTPATSTIASPVVQYNTPGTYDVSLSVTNSSGTVSTTKTAYVNVKSLTAMYANTTYSEGFEGSLIPNVDWQVKNQLPEGNTWTQTSVAAATGTKSVRLVNSPTYDTYVDELIGPSVDMTLIAGSNPTMTFKVAHAQNTSTGLGSADKLQVYVSPNCGATWTLRKTLIGAALSTAGVNSTWTTPTSTQWALQTVSLSGYAFQTNLYFMFRFTSNAGNNVYIDDINISGTVGIQDEVANNLDFNVYPNPVEENTLISFNLLEKQKVKIQLYDILGQEALSIFNGNLDAGDHVYPIAEKTNFPSGIYFVKLTVKDQFFIKKIIVQ